MARGGLFDVHCFVVHFYTPLALATSIDANDQTMLQCYNQIILTDRENGYGK